VLRRTLFGLGVVAAVGLFADDVEASIGETIELRPKAAPYPCPDGAYADPTVLVFVPAFFALPKSGRVDFVVHFHGHMTTAKRAIVAHRLREQMAASRQNAILVVPQGPVAAADGDFGKLMKKGGLERLLAEVRRSVATLRKSKAVGRVVLSAHSGGYRAAAACSTLGRVDVREVYLFDALYGEVATFAAFAASDKRRKLVSYAVGGRPRELGADLAQRLEARGVPVIREAADRRVTRGELVKARAAFLAGHATHATATYEELALRECLFASCLRGKGSAAWHSDHDASRAS